MRLLFALSVPLFVTLGVFANGSRASAEEIVILRPGKNVTAFHMDVCGRDLFTKEPFEDHWWRYMDALNAVYRPLHKRTGKKFFFPTIREADNLNNACALIHNGDGQRYVVVDPNIWNREQTGFLGEMLIYGHEIGHHVCGHSIGAFRGNRWEKELEADRFAGAALKALYDDTEITDYRSIYEQFTFQAVVDSASGIFGPMISGPTHPPGNLRIAAVRDGYLNGSPCVERAENR